MADKKQENLATESRESKQINASPREVLAARLLNMEKHSTITPKMQRQIDRMIAKTEKRSK